MSRSMVVLLALVCPALADEATGDLKKMEGTWRATSYFADGKKVPARDVAIMKLIIKGSGENELQVGKQKHFGTYALDESATPKTIDIAITKGESKGKKKLGIYELKNNTLRICVGPLDGPRPTAFISEPKTGVWLEEWQRLK